MAKRAFVVATVAVEVTVGPWGESETVAALFATAEREAEEKVRCALQKTPIRISGVTTSRVVMVNEVDPS